MNWKFLNQPLGRCDLSGGYAPEKKPIWPAIIMAAVAAGSAIYGAAKSNSDNNKAQAQLDAENAKLEAEKAITKAERRRKMYENPLDRADVQNVIRVAQQQADKIYKKAEGEAAVMGSTDASKQMAKDAGNKVVGDAVADIYANDAARKDLVDAQYRAEERGLNQEQRGLIQQQIALQQQRAQNTANAAGQVSSAMLNGALSYLGAGSPGGSGVTAPQGGTPKLQQMGSTYYNNYKTLNPYIGQALRGYGTL